MSNSAEWDRRESLAIKYKGQSFYTITPLPYYLKRRRKLLDLIENDIKNSKNVLDLGCGDGWYLNYFEKLLEPSVCFTGIDVSPNMIRSAQELNPKMSFHLCDDKVPDILGIFDYIYTVSVFAHVGDDVLDTLVASCNLHLEKGGRLTLFEQCAPLRTSGESYIRRTYTEYCEVLRKNDFEIDKSFLIDFSAHRWFERNVTKRIYKLYSSSLSSSEKRIQANKSSLFRMLSKLFLLFDSNPIKPAADGWGYIYITAIKK